MDSNAEAYDFEPIFSSLSGFHRIYIDLPAHGCTPSYQVQNLDDIYTHLEQFIDQRIGSTSHFLLVGSSCGAYLARALATSHAQQIDGLLLRVPVINPESRMRDVDQFEPLIRCPSVLEDALSQTPSHSLDDTNVLIQTPNYITALDSKFIKAILPAVHRADNEVLDMIRDDPQRYQLGPKHHDNLLRKFLAPTLILTGRHDTDVGYRDSLALTANYPRSTYVVLDRGTHALPVDERGVFDALVHDWLYRVAEWRSLADRKVVDMLV